MNKIEIGNKVKQQREAIKMSYYKLAKDTNCTIRQIYAIENGDKSYTIDSLLKVMSVLQLTLDIPRDTTPDRSGILEAIAKRYSG